MTTPSDLKHVTRYWKNDEAAKLTDGLDRLTYRSNKLGDDQRVTNTGGGNTSSKIQRPTRSPARRLRSSGSRARAATSAPPSVPTSPRSK